MTKTRKALAVTAAAIVALSLAGCTTYSKAQALETPNSVIELTNATLFETSTFGYVNSDGQVIDLTECGQESFFDQKYCEDPDGIFRFQWSVYKGGRIGSASYTINGVKHDMTCNADADDTWSGYYVCVPNS